MKNLSIKKYVPVLIVILLVIFTKSYSQITVNPSSVQVCNGGNTFFYIQATGSNKVYKWQDSISSWANISSGSVYSNPNNDTLYLTGTPYSYNNRRYRCMVDINNDGTFDYTSKSALLTVYPTLSPGTIGSNQTICYNTSPSSIGFTTSPSGGGSTYSYQWQKSTDGTNYSDISGATNNTYTSGVLTVTTYFKVKVTSTKGCGNDVSNAVTITVLSDLNPGVIGDSSTICYGSSPTTLKFNTNPSGSNGTYTYQWQKSSTYNGTYTDISSATSTTYSPGALTSDTYFKVKVTPTHTCATKTTNIKGIKVWPNVTKATIGSDHSVCYGVDASSISITTAPSGGGSGFSNQWQSSTTYGGTYSDISGQTGNSYDDNTLLYSNKYYRLKSLSQYNCGPVYSDPLTVNVYSVFSQGTIGSNQTICYNSSPSTIGFTTNPSGGGSTYSYQWQKSTDGTNYSVISGATNSTYSSGALTVTTFFKVKVTSTAGCGSEFSNVITITVLSDLNPGIIGDSSTICYGASPTTLKINTSPTGSNGSYSYQWQKSSTYGGTYSDISSATSTTYSPGTLTSDTYFKLKITPTYPCNAKTTNPVGVKVWPNVSKATIGSDHSVCYGVDASSISITTAPSGGGLGFSNQWQSSTSYGGTYSDISGQTGNSYDDNTLLYSNKYYRLKSLSQYSCGPVYSDPLTVTVYTVLNPGVIGSNQTICYNTPCSSIIFTTSPSGGGSTYSYQWQKSTDGTNYSDISGATNSYYTSGNLTVTTYYKVKVTSTKSCGFDFSNVVTITVLSDLNPGVIGDSSTICYGSSPTTLKFNTNPSGSNGTYTYQWQKSSTYNGTYTDISSATSTTYSPGALTSDTYFKVKVTPTHTCAAKTTNSVGVKVWSNVTKATIGADHSICYGTDANSITITTNPSGGGLGFSNQWQKSTSYSGTYSDISGQTGNSYDDATILYNNSYYRLKSTSQYSCGPVYSDPVTVTVYSPLNSGTIGSNQTICYNTNPTAIVFTTPASGEDNNYNYLWEKSSDGTTGWTTVGTNSNTLSTGSLTTTTYYHCIVTSKKCSTYVTTNVVKITVYNQLSAGTISKDQTICYNTSPSALSFTTAPTGEDNNYNYQWEKSSNGTSGWTTTGTNSNTLSPGSLTATTYFHCKVTSKSCSTTVTTNVVKITVNNPLNAGTIGNAQTICYNTSPTMLVFTTAASGEDTNYTYQWEKSSNGTSGWTSIGSNSTTYSPGNLTTTTYYHCIVSSIRCSTNVTTNTVKITVNNILNAGVIGNTQTICYNTSPANLVFTTAASGEDTNYNYVWEKSSDGTTGWTTVGTNSNTLSIGSLTTTTYYHCIVTSKKCSTYVTTNVVKITVYNQLSAGTISKDQTICYNTSPSALSFTTAPTGEDNNYNYQWEKSSNGTSGWTTIGTNSNTLSPGSLTATTYFHCKVTSKSCSTTVTTNVVKITVNNPLNAGTIGNAQTICYNTSPTMLVFTTTASGEDTNYNYQWEKSSNGTSGWTSVGTNSNTSSPGNLTSSTYYHCIVTSKKCSTNVTTNVVKITVNNPLNAGTIGNAQTICYNTSPNVLTFTTPASGEDTNYNYLWEKSSNGTTGWTTVGTNSNTLSTGNLTTTTYYHCIVTSKKCSTFVTTNSVKITVLPNLQSGNIGDHDTICYNASSNLLKFNIKPSGADLNYIYQWEESFDKSNWSIISGASDTVYNPGKLIKTTYYHAKVTSTYGCGTLTTNNIEIKVWPKLKKADISPHQFLCYGTDPKIINMTNQPTGGGDGFSYKWYKSTDGYNWDSINGGINSTFDDTTKLYSNTNYKVLTTSQYGCGPIASDSVHIHVYDPLNAGKIENSDTICYDASTTTLKFKNSNLPSGADGKYSYQWEKSLDLNNWTTISGEKDSVLNPGKLILTTYYRIKVTSTYGCGTLSTDSVQIFVYDEFLPGKIWGNDTVCSNYAPVPNRISSTKLPSGANGKYYYQWFHSYDGINFQDTINEVDTFVLLGKHYKTKYYFLKYSTICGDRFSDTHRVHVNPLPIDVLLNGPKELCKNSADVLYTIDNKYPGYSYFWICKGGEINSGMYNDTIRVKWFNETEIDTLLLTQTINATGCFKTLYYPITAYRFSAPPQVDIIRKPKSNLLFLTDTNFNYIYHWGFEEKVSGSLTNMEAFNDLWYCIYPHFDTISYIYWLNLGIDYDSVVCSTKSFFISPFVGIAEKYANNKRINLKIYPNPANSYLIYELDNTNNENVIIILRDLYGREIKKIEYSDIIKIRGEIDLNTYSKGMYFIDATINDNQRKIVQFLIK